MSRSTKEPVVNTSLRLSTSSPPPRISGSRVSGKMAVTSGDTVTVYGRDGRQLFQHDGHRAGVGVAAWHTAVDNIVFSADTRNNLHAWAFVEDSSN